jgi:N6-adenosine-specific RNA methylase IME4/ParB-like chromosome segregation protein Spo0J
MPPLAPEEYEALKTDIALRGVQVPIEYDEFGAILDGHHRERICRELGLSEWPRLIRYGLSHEEKLRHARRLNLDRRHLSAEQRRKLIAEDLKAAPSDSNRKIAAGLGVDDKTVASVRADLESTAEIPQLKERQGRDGKARKIVYMDPSPAGIRGTKEAAKALFKAERDANGEARTRVQQMLSDESAKLPGGRKFAVIYADPATRFLSGLGPKSIENHYRTMTHAELCALGVSDRALMNAEMFIWSTVPQLANTFAIAAAWGFPDYSSSMMWDKTSPDHPNEMGTGYVFRNQHEILLRFTRGSPRKPAIQPLSIYRERKTEHSRKPEYFRKMIAEMAHGLPVLELFARVDAEHPLPVGWEPWGNEAGSHIADASAERAPPAEPPKAASPEHIADVNKVIPAPAVVRKTPVEDDLAIPAFLDRRINGMGAGHG